MTQVIIIIFRIIIVHGVVRIDEYKFSNFFIQKSVTPLFMYEVEAAPCPFACCSRYGSVVNANSTFCQHRKPDASINLLIMEWGQFRKFFFFRQSRPLQVFSSIYRKRRRVNFHSKICGSAFVTHKQV